MQVLERLQFWRWRHTVALAVVLVTAVLAHTPFGAYVEGAVFSKPYYKTQALFGGAPVLDERVRLVLADDLALKRLDRQPRFRDWLDVARQLRVRGFEQIVLQESQSLGADIGDLPATEGAPYLIAGAVAARDSVSSRAVPASSVPASWLLPAPSEGQAEANAIIAPAPAAWPFVAALGHVNIDQDDAVAAAFAVKGAGLLPHLALRVRPDLKPEDLPLRASLQPEFVTLASVLQRSVSLSAFFPKDGAIAARVEEKLAGGRIAILVPAAFTGSRVVTSPVEGNVPAYVHFSSFVHGALKGRFVHVPVPRALVLWLAAALWVAAASLGGNRRSLLALGVLTVLAIVTSVVALPVAGWLLPAGGLALTGVATILLRAAIAWLQAKTGKLRLEGQIALGAEVQKRLFPAAWSGTVGPWHYRCFCEPHGAMSGDWLQIFRQDDPVAPFAVLAIGDVVGKGPSAALLTATIAAIWSDHAHRWKSGAPDVDGLITAIDKAVYRTFNGEQNTTIALAYLTATEVRLCQAGGPGWIGVDAHRAALPIRWHRHDPLGLFDRSVTLKSHVAAANRGDVLVAYTDGVIDGLTERRLFQKALETASLPEDPEARDLAVRDLARASGHDSVQPDDFTLLVIQRL